MKSVAVCWRLVCGWRMEKEEEEGGIVRGIRRAREKGGNCERTSPRLVRGQEQTRYVWQDTREEAGETGQSRI